MKITSKLLRSKGACSAQVQLFKDLGGDRLELTEALCLEHASKFDWSWAARNLLSKPASAKYKRVTAPASAEYKRVRDAAWAEYERVTALAWAEYACARNLTYAEYERIIDVAWAEYERVRATTFYRLWKGENPQ